MIGKTGTNIRKIRKSLGYTQTEVAERLFTTAQNISRVESGEGEPTAEMLIGLSALFGVSIDTLIGNDVLSEPELMNRVRMFLKSADRDEMPEKIFRICKNMLYGRYDAAFGEHEVSDVPTYATMTARNFTGVFFDRPDRPPIFAAVGTNAVELCEKREVALTEIFGALSDRKVFQIVDRLSRSPRNDRSYDKTSFCSAFGVDEAAFEALLARLTTLKLVTAKAIAFDDSTVTVYRPSLNNEIVLLLSLADLLYNASPDGSVHG